MNCWDSYIDRNPSTKARKKGDATEQQKTNAWNSVDEGSRG